MTVHIPEVKTQVGIMILHYVVELFVEMEALLADIILMLIGLHDRFDSLVHQAVNTSCLLCYARKC